MTMMRSEDTALLLWWDANNGLNVYSPETAEDEVALPSSRGANPSTTANCASFSGIGGRVSGVVLVQLKRRRFASRCADKQKQNTATPTSAMAVTEPRVIPTTVPADSAAVEGDGDGVTLGVWVEDDDRDVDGVMLKDGVTEMVGVVDDDFVAKRRARGCSRRRRTAEFSQGKVNWTVDGMISTELDKQAH
jgi:hypothetical protein